jgi:hypothetical protein
MTVTTVAGGNGQGLAAAVDIRPTGFALTSDGLYVLDQAHYGGYEDSASPDNPVGISEALRRVDPSTGAMTVLADNQTPGFLKRTDRETNAAAGGPMAGAPDGSVYWVDFGTGYLRKRDPSGAITDVAGNGQPSGPTTPCPFPTTDLHSFSVGSDDIAVGSAGQIYLWGGCGPGPQIVEIQNGTASVIAGAGSNWSASGISGDGGPAVNATFTSPKGFGTAPNGALYVVDDFGYRVRKIDSSGIINTVAGGENANGPPNGGGGPATSAVINATDVAPHPDGSYDIAEPSNSRIRHVDPSGTISTIATNVTPGRISADAAGVDYWTDTAGIEVDRLTAPGVVQRVVGNGGYPDRAACCHSGDGGPATAARLADAQYGIAVDPAGDVIVSDAAWIREITPAGTIRTIAGGLGSTPTLNAYTGPALSMAISPTGLVLEPDGSIVFNDPGALSLRRLSPTGLITTIANVGYAAGLARDSHGNFFITATPYSGDSGVFKVTPDGQVSCYAYCPGQPSYSYGDGGPAAAAVLKSPLLGLATDPQDDLFVADAGDDTVRRISPDGKISTVTATARSDANGGGYPIADRTILHPNAITAFGPDDLVVSGSDGIISIVNGHASVINAQPQQFEDTALGDGGRADAASFNTVQAIAHDAAGNLYLSDTGNGRIRKLTLPASSSAPTPTPTPTPTLTTTPTPTPSPTPTATASPVSITGASTRTTTYGSSVNISGTATPGATVGIWFHEAGSNGYVQRRTLTASSTGAWSTSYTANDDYRVYAGSGTTQSGSVLVQIAPAISGANPRTVPRNSTCTVSGTGIPGATLTVHFHKASTATNDYSILRTVTVASNGTWTRSYLASVDYRLYASLPNGQISTNLLVQAR